MPRSYDAMITDQINMSIFIPGKTLLSLFPFFWDFLSVFCLISCQAWLFVYLSKMVPKMRWPSSAKMRSKMQTLLDKLAVETVPGLSNAQLMLINHDLLPVEPERRQWTWKNFVAFWIADSLNIVWLFPISIMHSFAFFFLLSFSSLSLFFFSFFVREIVLNLIGSRIHGWYPPLWCRVVCPGGSLGYVSGSDTSLRLL